MSEHDIIYNCHECSWNYSLQRNKVCPMCQVPPEINEDLVVETIQEYSRRKGIFIKKKEGKSLASSFKKKYKRLPTFKEIWTLADKILKQKAGGDKVSLEDKVAKKMAEMKAAADDKQQRKKEVAAKRAGIEKVSSSSGIEKVSSKPSFSGYENDLNSLGFLTISNVKNIAKMAENLPDDKQQMIIQRLKSMELEFSDLESQGLNFTEDEKAQFREKNIKLNNEKRNEQLKILAERKKSLSVRSKCGKCGAANPGDSNFCLECGAKLK